MEARKLLFGCLIIVSIVHALGNQDRKGNKPETADLVYHGSADGKSFYVELVTIRKWPQAKSFCQNAGMKLVSINTPGQNALLSNITANYFLWTSGRDSGKIEQFVWDENDNETPDTAAVPTFENSLYGPLTCLSYYGGRYRTFACETKLYTICEKPDIGF